MSGVVMRLLSRTDFNFANVQGNQTVTVWPTQDIDVSRYREGTMLVRVHSSTIGPTATLVAALRSALPSKEDPAQFFRARPTSPSWCSATQRLRHRFRSPRYWHLRDRAKRDARRLEAPPTNTRSSPELVAKDIMRALAKRDEDALSRLASTTHFSFGGLGGHTHFADPKLVLPHLMRDLRASKTIWGRPEALDGREGKRYLMTGGWVGRTFLLQTAFQIVRMSDRSRCARRHRPVRPHVAPTWRVHARPPTCVREPRTQLQRPGGSVDNVPGRGGARELSRRQGICGCGRGRDGGRALKLPVVHSIRVAPDGMTTGTSRCSCSAAARQSAASSGTPRGARACGGCAGCA